MSARFAVYFLPEPGSALARLGDSWLGDAPPPVPGVTPERLRALTASARHYGFHATLKPPFALRAGTTADRVLAEVRAFAAAREAFDLRLRLASLDGFLALVPAEPSPAMQALGDACVAAFEPFRAAADAAEVERRRVGLSPRQEDHLARFGYPHVFEDFAVHMTLTERLAEPDLATVRAALRTITAEAVAAPARVGAVAVCVQEDRSAAFRLGARCPFGPPSDGSAASR